MTVQEMSSIQTHTCLGSSDLASTRVLAFLISFVLIVVSQLVRSVTRLRLPHTIHLIN